MPNRAYLLVNVHAAREAEVQQALRGLEEVIACDQVTGDNDLIAVVEAPDYQHILGPLLQKIRNIEGISHTVTCLVL
ncbi:MAG: Lrp/AsnC ligand binding domain-containing protein [Candidatus Sumerlaeia bacterium]|nr:Lrp/AsnC ligand binding domain-containing protein [Candidatus Sumerlaeia bacterium]